MLVYRIDTRDGGRGKTYLPCRQVWRDATDLRLGFQRKLIFLPPGRTCHFFLLIQLPHPWITGPMVNGRLSDQGKHIQVRLLPLGVRHLGHPRRLSLERAHLPQVGAEWEHGLSEYF